MLEYIILYIQYRYLLLKSSRMHCPVYSNEDQYFYRCTKYSLDSVLPCSWCQHRAWRPPSLRFGWRGRGGCPPALIRIPGNNAAFNLCMFPISETQLFKQDTGRKLSNTSEVFDLWFFLCLYSMLQGELSPHGQYKYKKKQIFRYPYSTNARVEPDSYGIIFTDKKCFTKLKIFL